MFSFEFSTLLSVSQSGWLPISITFLVRGHQHQSLWLQWYGGRCIRLPCWWKKDKLRNLIKSAQIAFLKTVKHVVAWNVFIFTAPCKERHLSKYSRAKSSQNSLVDGQLYLRFVLTKINLIGHHQTCLFQNVHYYIPIQKRSY